MAIAKLRSEFAPKGDLDADGIAWDDMLRVLSAVDSIDELSHALVEPTAFRAKLATAQEPVARMWAIAQARRELEPKLARRDLRWVDALPALTEKATAAEVNNLVADPKGLAELLSPNDDDDGDASASMLRRMFKLLSGALRRSGFAPVCEAIERLSTVSSTATLDSPEHLGFALVAFAVAVLEIVDGHSVSTDEAKDATARQVFASAHRWFERAASSRRAVARARSAFEETAKAAGDDAKTAQGQLDSALRQLVHDQASASAACDAAVETLLRNSRLDPSEKAIINAAVVWMLGLRSVMSGLPISLEQRQRMAASLEDVAMIAAAAAAKDNPSLAVVTRQKVSTAATLIDALISLMNGDADSDGFLELAKQLGANAQAIEALEMAQELAKTFMPLIDMTRNVSKTADLQNLAKKGADVTFRAIFDMFDADGSGAIDFAEFSQIFKYMGVYLSKEQLTRIYSAADGNGDGVIQYQDFDACLSQLYRMVVETLLNDLGLDRWTLLSMMVFFLLFLAVLLVFIFKGVEALSSMTGSFSSMINAAMPMVAGGGVAKLTAKDFSIPNLQDAVKSGLAAVGNVV